MAGTATIYATTKSPSALEVANQEEDLRVYGKREIPRWGRLTLSLLGLVLLGVIAVISLGAKSGTHPRPTAEPEPVLGVLSPPTSTLPVPPRHGMCAAPVPSALRWGSDVHVADDICCNNHHFAEHAGYWLETTFTAEQRSAREVTFYDSTTNRPLFVAPRGRTWEAFIAESTHHGWPSFRDAEVIAGGIVVAQDGETLSQDGTHLGHNLPDATGNRYCIDIVCIAGMLPVAAPPSSPSPAPTPSPAPSLMPATAPADTRHVVLNNGVVMPLLAFAANLWAPAVCTSATAAAIDAGFRYVWSSVLVGADCQRAQRAAIDAHPSTNRAALFLAGTVDTSSCSSEATCKSDTLAGALEQRRRLGPEPLDQLMLDYPSRAGCPAIRGQWAAFTDLYESHQVRSIAVSNFGTTELSCLLGSGAPAGTLVPAVNQLRFSVGQTANVDLALHHSHGITVQAYSPLGSGAVVRNPTVAAIGEARTPTRSAAQVGLRYILQKGIAVATQSTNDDHLAEDADIFEWSLTANEMAELDAVAR